MTLQIPEDLAEAVEAAAKTTGVPADQLVIDALRAHFPPIEPELRAEFDAWDAASDEAMQHVDRLLGEST